MRISQTSLTCWINHFYGYGVWDARCWFVAYEEGGGDLPGEVAEKMQYFEQLNPAAEGAILCDIRDLYRHVSMPPDDPKAHSFSHRHEYRFGSNAIPNNVWKNLIAFVHGYKDETRSDPLQYQRLEFASPARREEALIRLYPLPSPHNHAWYYSWLDLPQLDFLKSRASYEKQFYPDRISTILSNMRLHQPEVVLMYGMNNINMLKKSVADHFPGVAFKMVKATSRQIPQHHKANIHGTTFLITTQVPTLRHHRIETGFDWYAFGKKVRSENT